MGIVCVRLRPYRMGSEILIDATQIIPLPESADYEVKLRAQENEKKKVVSARHEIFRRFWKQFIDRSKPRTQLLANRNTSGDHWLSAGIGRSGFSLNLSLTQSTTQVECYIRLGQDAVRSLAAFEALRTMKTQIEAAFGEPLDWQDLPGRNGCRICTEFPGGWKSPEPEWPEMQDRMIDALIRLEKALRRPIQELSV